MHRSTLVYVCVCLCFPIPPARSFAFLERLMVFAVQERYGSSSSSSKELILAELLRKWPLLKTCAVQLEVIYEVPVPRFGCVWGFLR